MPPVARRLVIAGLLLVSSTGLLAQAPPLVRAKVDDVDRVVGRGPFAANWTSLATFTVPEWYEDAKFGIFIHWGLYSVPAFGNEWYPRNMYRRDQKEFAHHVATYGPQAQFG